MTNFSLSRLTNLATSPLRLDTYRYHAATKEILPVIQDDNAKVMYRSTLIQAMHPETKFALLDCHGLERECIADVLREDHNLSGTTYHFDFASGARKHGIFILSDNNISSQYFIEDYRRVSHGSILTTNCHQGMYLLKNVKLVVLDETEFKEYQTDLGLGDCFGVVGHNIGKHFTTQMQFRAGVTNQWIAKGCVLPVKGSLPCNADIILPKSSFKGYHPELGTVLEYPEMYFGVHLEAKNRIGSASHTGLVWFSRKESINHLTELAQVKFDELSLARQDLKSCAEMVAKHLGSNYVKDVEAFESDEDGIQEEDQDELPLATILKSPNANQLLHHPKITDVLNRLWSKKYSQVALSAGITGRYLMAAPMVELPAPYIISHDLPTGEYIMQRYPIRGRMDIKQVIALNPRDINSTNDEWIAVYDKAVDQSNESLTSNGINRFQQYYGNFLISPDYFAEVGGDFDGDCALFLSANDHHVLYDEISQWELPPEPTKKKVPLTGDVYDVAADSTDNLAGLVTWLNIFRFIAGIESIAYKNDFINLNQELALQLQYAVDSFKSGVSVDEELLDGLGKILKVRYGEQISWLSDYKQTNEQRSMNNALYQHRNSSVDLFFEDPISQLTKVAQENWRECEWKPLPSPSFQSLFDWHEVSESQIAWGARWYSRYVDAISKCFAGTKDEDGKIIVSPAHFQRCLDSYKEMIEGYREDFSHLDPSQRLGVANVIWKAAHRASSNKAISREKYSFASVCFQLFPKEIVVALEKSNITEICGYISSDIKDAVDIESLRGCQIRIQATKKGLVVINLNTNSTVMNVATKSQGKAYRVPCMNSEWHVKGITPVLSKKKDRIVNYVLSV